MTDGRTDGRTDPDASINSNRPDPSIESTRSIDRLDPTRPRRPRETHTKMHACRAARTARDRVVVVASRRRARTRRGGAMTVVKRTNRCATVAFGCDRSIDARDERTNERRECRDASGLGQIFNARARDVGKTRDDGDARARGMRVKRLTMCARGVPCAMTRVGRTRRFSRREPWLGRSI